MDAKEVTVTIGKQRPFTITKITGDQGSDLTQLFTGNIQFSSLDDAIASMIGDATTLAGKVITGGTEGDVTVHATGTALDGRNFAVDVTVHAVAAPPPPLEQVASIDIEFGEEEAIGT